MLLRIILGISGCLILIIILFIIALYSIAWKTIPTTLTICAIYDEIFGIYLTEGLFSREQPEEISIGKITVKFSNLEEACNEIEKYVNMNLKNYDKYTWLNVSPEWGKNRNKLITIKSKICWLRKKF